MTLLLSHDKVSFELHERILKCPKELALSDPKLSKKDRRRLNTALNLAKNSPCNQKHGAIVVKGGRVVGTGINTNRNDPSDWIDAEIISVHAEIAAISRVRPETLKGATVYVARTGKCLPHMLSRPCPRCYAALKAAGVKRIIYTD